MSTLRGIASTWSVSGRRWTGPTGYASAGRCARTHGRRSERSPGWPTPTPDPSPVVCCGVSAGGAPRGESRLLRHRCAARPRADRGGDRAGRRRRRREVGDDRSGARAACLVACRCRARERRPVSHRHASARARDRSAARLSRHAESHVVDVLPEGVVPELARVQQTDGAEIGVFEDRSTDATIVVCALDNLGKGAAGQAIQNVNVLFGFDETTGLRLSGVLV